MASRRVLGAVTALPVLLGATIATAPPGAHADTARARTASSAGDILGAIVGIPQTSRAWGAGDTWAGDGNIYATSDDGRGFNDTCHSNIVVNELTGSGPASLASPYVNCMTSYGRKAQHQNYRDGRTWKTEGLISVGGTLYLAVARQVDGHGGYPAGYQSSDDVSIIKSVDNGRTWSNGFGTSRDPAGRRRRPTRAAPARGRCSPPRSPHSSSSTMARTTTWQAPPTAGTNMCTPSPTTAGHTTAAT